MIFASPETVNASVGLVVPIPILLKVWIPTSVFTKYPAWRPVKLEPSPLNDVAVTTPVAMIPLLAVIKPTESTFVTSS